MKNKISILLTLFLIAGIFAGCASNTTATVQESADITASSVASDTASEDSMFTDRDKEIGYSEADSTIVTLKDDASTVDGSGVTIAENIITISEEGTYIISGSLSNGQILVNGPEDAKIQLVLNGVDISNESSAAIYVKQANKVFITTANGTNNTLSVTGEYVAVDENNIDAVIFSKSDLTLNGAGILTANGKYGHGIVSKDDLAVTSGTYNITSAEHGISGKNSVRIADGTFNIESGTDAIHSENEDDTALGFVYIEGGKISINAGDDGIHAGNYVKICGGTVDISESYEGIEGLTIDISGGDISVVSSDDGLNAAGGSDQSAQDAPQMGANMSASDCLINISGGTLTVNASGDGIDSNGSITISGGIITVSGPTENMNGTIDYNGAAEITGGTLLGAGSSGMAEGFSDSSTQCSILYNLSGTQQAGTKITLTDESGNVIAGFAPEKQFQAIYISVAALAQGKTYTLSVGSEEFTIELNASTYSNGGGGMGTGAMGGGHGDFGGGQPPQGTGGKMTNGQAPQADTGTNATSSATVQQ